jgi:hypothetical protein
MIRISTRVEVKLDLEGTLTPWFTVLEVQGMRDVTGEETDKVFNRLVEAQSKELGPPSSFFRDDVLFTKSDRLNLGFHRNAMWKGVIPAEEMARLEAAHL